MSKPKQQYTLFPTGQCSVCGVKLNEPVTTCPKCVAKWLESIQLEGKSVFKINKEKDKWNTK